MEKREHESSPCGRSSSWGRVMCVYTTNVCIINTETDGGLLWCAYHTDLWTASAPPQS